MRPNRRVSEVSLSRTLALDARAKELAAAGRDVVNLTAGEPDFDAPARVRAVAREFVDGGRVRYTPAAGAPSLRAAIAAWLGRTRGGAWQAADVVVCNSAKHALSSALLALVEPGDEVLLPLPAWVSYVEQVRFAGGVPVGVAPRADLGPDLDAQLAAAGTKARGIMLNSPCNPSGYVMSRDELAAIVELCVERDLWIVSDEIYRRLVYDGGTAPSPVEAHPAARERCVVVDGASKAWAMTGYRIGFAAAPPAITDAITRLNSQLTGCPNAISQAAFEAALADEPPEVEAMCRAFEARRRRVLAGLAALGVDVPRPAGAFYVFIDVRPWLDERGTDGFCADLLEREGLALVPG
jgi:aspartate aminotransferase